MNNRIKDILIFAAICAAVTAMLVLINAVTAPIIAGNDADSETAELSQVLPNGGSFKEQVLSSVHLPQTVDAVYAAANGGHVVRLHTNGYAGGMVLLCGIHADGTVAATKLLASNETPAIGGIAAETFAAAVIGTDRSSVQTLDTVAGATVTTAAYRSAVQDALNAVFILGGGSVDLRTDAQRLADRLSEALPLADGAFTKHFFTEEIAGVDAVYFADNGTGAVCVLGEAFIALDAALNVLTACDETVRQTVQAAMQAITASHAAELNLTAVKGLPRQLVRAQRTDSGNYVLDINAVGYGILGGSEYHPASGEYIRIRVSVTPDGRIIDCLTLSQAETDGIGSVCASEDFYGQFDGTTAATCQQTDAISGATLTTNGYRQAILLAFECVQILEEDVT